MTKKEAIQAMLDGKRIKQTKWEQYNYLYMDEFGDVRDSKAHLLSTEYMGKDNWKLYQEPLKTESWARFRVWDTSTKTWYDSVSLHRNIHDYKSYYSDNIFSNHHEIEGTRVDLPVVED